MLVTSRLPARLEAARGFGALAINPAVDDLGRTVSEWTDGEGADVVADCIGTKASIREGLLMLRPGGKLLVIAYVDDAFEVPSIPLFAREREIIGCRGATRQDLVDVARLAAQGRIQPVIGARYPLAGIAEAVRCLEEGDVVGRIVLTR